MRALILAAGRGTRISRYLSGNPKCTVTVGEKRLIEYTVELLRSRGIRKIGMVLGYRHEVIEEILKDKDIDFYYNPFFDVTNSIASAWFAKDFFSNEDMLIMNGDVFLEESLLDVILKSEKNPVLFADKTRCAEADYKFYCKNGILLKYGKELSLEETSAEYIGIAKMDGEFVEEFTNKMENMICKQEHSVWWENILYSMTDKRDIYIEDVEGKFWAEVDYIEDYERIQKFVDKNGLFKRKN